MSDTTGAFSGASQRAGNRLSEAANKAEDTATQAGNQLSGVLDEIEGTIRQNPWLAVLAATAVGTHGVASGGGNDLFPQRLLAA